MENKISEYKACKYFHSGVICPNSSYIVVHKLACGRRCYAHKTNYLPQMESFHAVLRFIRSIFIPSDLAIYRMSREKHG